MRIAALLVLVLLPFGAVAADAAPAERTEVKDRKAIERLRGNGGITLQWIGWDKRGTLEARQDGALLRLNGGQTATDGRGRLALDGKVVSIDTKSFVFEGRIVISDTPDIGRECVRDGRFTFRITQQRRYWRLQEMEMCDGLTDYVDIYF